MINLDSSIHRIINRLDNYLNHRHGNELPRRVNLHNFILTGCKFDVSTPVEVYRIEEYGGEEEFTRHLISALRSDDVFYDIGACIGFVSIHAAKRCTNVIAFEPDLNHRTRLIKNIQLNRSENIKIIEWAVSDTQGSIPLYSDGINSQSPGFVNIGRSDFELVDTNSIDNALKTGEIPYPNVIKMDIEGAEFLALKGMEQLLSSERAPRRLYLELHPDLMVHLESSPSEIKTMLSRLGYKEIYIKQRDIQLHCVYDRS